MNDEQLNLSLAPLLPKSIHHWKPALQGFQLVFGENRVLLDAL
ncbi:hypothetical protein [Thermomonas paludicola]|nr:hypothetical protein [Thermomonas paludicola]